MKGGGWRVGGRRCRVEGGWGRREVEEMNKLTL